MKFPRRIVDTRALHLLLITAARISQGLGRRQRWAGRERFQSHWDGWSPHSPFDISRRGKKKKMKSAYTVLLLWDGKRRERRKNDHFEFFICCGMTPSVAEVVLTSRGAIYSPCWLVFFLPSFFFFFPHYKKPMALRIADCPVSLSLFRVFSDPRPFDDFSARPVSQIKSLRCRHRQQTMTAGGL